MAYPRTGAHGPDSVPKRKAGRRRCWRKDELEVNPPLAGNLVQEEATARLAVSQLDDSQVHEVRRDDAAVFEFPVQHQATGVTLMAGHIEAHERAQFGFAAGTLREFASDESEQFDDRAVDRSAAGAKPDRLEADHP